MIKERCDANGGCGRWLVEVDGDTVVKCRSGVLLSDWLEQPPPPAEINGRVPVDSVEYVAAPWSSVQPIPKDEDNADEFADPQPPEIEWLKSIELLEMRGISVGATRDTKMEPGDWGSTCVVPAASVTG